SQAAGSAGSQTPLQRGAANRIRREFCNFMKEPVEGCHVEPDEENIFSWKATITGPQGSPYEGGVFDLSVSFPQDYPFSPPTVIFNSPIYHCNIASTGYICIDILGSQWSPALTISKVLISISSFLSEPNPDDPLDPILADLFKHRRDEYEENARLWTSQFAIPD
ncbi:hypothetical protein KR200_003888, partial [Drosophila serrata]